MVSWGGPDDECAHYRFDVAAQIVLTKTLAFMQTVPTTKSFKWDESKNTRITAERGISFEMIAWHLRQGELLYVYDHPNQLKYKGPRIFVVKINNYAWLVPFVETEDEIFLKIIIPSRKATKQYLGGSP